MRKILQYVEEYLLGTETRKFYKEERAWCKEFITDPKDLRKLLRNSKIEECLDLFVGKIVPNILGAGAIAYSLITEKPPYGLVLGEGLRLACIASSNKRKKKLMRRLVQSGFSVADRLRDISDNLQSLVDRLDNEDEEWKKD